MGADDRAFEDLLTRLDDRVRAIVREEISSRLDQVAAGPAGAEPPALPTAEAAKYVGFKTPSGLRQARLKKQIRPIGKRGGRGTLMWAIEDLNAFAAGRRRDGAILEAKRPGAPRKGGTDGH